MAKELRVGLVGCQFMGKAHSNAWSSVGQFFPLKANVVMKAACDLNEKAAKTLADSWGWQSVETSIDDLVARDDIDLVDIAAPNSVHHLLAMKAIKAGKNVSCEKPLALNVAQAKEMCAAAKEAGVLNMIWHNYRRVPAISLAKKMIDDGLLGRIYHIRAIYLQDWCMDPEFPLAWRFKKEVAGSGAHGDLNAHIIDLARFLAGEIDSVTATLETFVKERPIEVAGGSLFAGKTGAEKGEVTVDDAVIALARFKSGALGTFEATRFAAGHNNANQIEINGSKGSIFFTFERMNELKYFNVDDPDDLKGFRTISATMPGHPFMEGYWPPGHVIGYEHTFINAARDLANAYAEGKQVKPDFEEGLRNQIVLEAMSESAEKKTWINIPDIS